MILYYTNQGFLFSAHSHGVVFSIKWFLFQAQSVYREFIEGYISVFYSNFFLYLVTIIILLLIIFLTANRDDKYKFCLTITCFTLSAFMFYFMLIFSGDTGFREYSLYVYHFDLIWQMKICLIMIIFFELGILIKNIKVFSICIILIIFFNLCMHQKNITYEILTQNRDLISYIKYKHQNKYYKSIYKDRYFIERIYAYFCYKNVPITIIKTNLYNNNSASEFIPFLEYYLRNVYNNCPEIINKVESNDELYRIYLEAGGPQISDEEIDKADFQALLNKNFVIYGKI
ncbi:MAG: hypothetical protein LUH05_05935 [Candidatus Gastranaerophilales bacterium]|nr:hypothetical protein [Candidatus Gastranaerophilales bacterium]